MTYKPITDQSHDTIDYYAFPSMLLSTLRSNSIHIAKNRGRRSTISYHPGPTGLDSDDALTGGSSIVAADLIGYEDGGLVDDTRNRELIGLQFSTHPSCPMFIQVPWFAGAGTDTIKVRIACEVANEKMDVYGSYFYYPYFHPRIVGYNGDLGQDYLPFRLDGTIAERLTLLNASGTFTDHTKDRDSYVELQTSANIQIYELKIKLNRSRTDVGQDDYDNGRGLTPLIHLSFCSRPSVGKVDGNYIIKELVNTDVNNSYLATITYDNLAAINPYSFKNLLGGFNSNNTLGKCHGGILVDSDTGKTFHQILQVRQDPENANNTTILVHPKLPSSSTGAKFTAYKLSQIKIHSITIENDYEGI